MRDMKGARALTIVHRRMLVVMGRHVLLAVLGLICVVAFLVLLRSGYGHVPFNRMAEETAEVLRKLVLPAPNESEMSLNYTGPSTFVPQTHVPSVPTTLAETTVALTLNATINTTAIATITTTTTPSCHTATFGTQCYKRVMWVMRYGVVQHPEWYPNVTVLSSFEETQWILYDKAESNCTWPPCQVPLDPSVARQKELSSMIFDHSQNDSMFLEQVPESKLGREDVEPSVCNPAMDISKHLSPFAAELSEPNKSSDHKSSDHIWHLPQSDLDRCFASLMEESFVSEQDRTYARNWCWVGFKEFGCHRHFYDHITWAHMQALASSKGVTSNMSFHPLGRPEVCDQTVLGGRVLWSWYDWGNARQWFQQQVSVYVLSLNTSIQRRATIEKRLGELQIPFEFVDGVDMRLPGALSAAQAEGLIPEGFNFTLAQEEAYRERQNMGTAGSIAGTVGCASGHFRAQHRGFLKNPKWITLILEDDVAPEDDFIPRLWHLVTQEVPCDWQAVSLNSRCPFGFCISPHLTRVQPDVNEPQWRCRHGVNYGFQGMLYRTNEIENLQRIWKPLVFNELQPHCLDVDVALASISDQVQFYAVPASQNPGFLHEVSEGSSRVNINFEKMDTTSTSTLLVSVTDAPVLSTSSVFFCGRMHDSNGVCSVDHRSKGWCSHSPKNCEKCLGSWCANA